MATRSLGAAEYGRPRADVAETRSAYPNARQAGFLFIGDVSAFGTGPKTITVRATAQTGIVRELVRTLDVPELRGTAPAGDASIEYHCDRVLLTTTGRLSLAGWIVCSAATTAIDVWIDGRKIGVAEFGIARSDVGNLFPSLPHARVSGFAVNCRLNLSSPSPGSRPCRYARCSTLMRAVMPKFRARWRSPATGSRRASMA